jgi:hypothetical protein
VAELQAKNEKLANLLADLVAANEGDTEARSLAVQYLEVPWCNSRAYHH